MKRPTTLAKQIWLAGAALAAALPAVAQTQAQTQTAEQPAATTLPGVTVQGAAWRDSPLVPSARRERRKLARIPGGTGLALPQDESRMTGLRDALAVQPGVVVQELFGGFDAPRLNVRGSGLQSHPVNRGVTLLIDGLPLNEADGSYVSGLADPRNTAQISIRRGANARSPSAESLGGEMDFQSLTGHDGRGRARLEAGSFGRRVWQAAVGAASETSGLDGRLNFGGERYRGFRHHSDGQRQSVQANAGWRGSAGLESRLWLGWTKFDYRIAGPLPPDRVYGDPSQVLGDGNTPRDRLLNLYQRNPHRNARQWRVASRTSWGDARLRHEIGLWWQSTNVEEQNMTRAAIWHSRARGVQWQSFFTPNAAWRWRVAAAWERSDMQRDFRAVQPRTGAFLSRFGSFDQMADNARISAGLDVDIAPGWTLAGELRHTRSRRNAQSRVSAAAQDLGWRYATPKVGLIWRPLPSSHPQDGHQQEDDLRLFANLSRSHEAPTFTDLVTGTAAANNPARTATALARLGLQSATTVEAGAEGTLGRQGGPHRARWQITLYRSAIKGELLRTADATGLQGSTRNYAGGTRHQGLEAGMAGSWRLAAQAGALEYRAAWTWSDYRFRGGAYAGKRIAGAPRHFAQAELLYRNGGWRAGPTLRWQPLDEYVDHANTPGYAQKRHALLGLRAEYRRGPWRIQIQGDNLTNKRYVSTFVVTDRANANMNLFPGSGRSVTMSASYEF